MWLYHIYITGDYLTWLVGRNLLQRWSGFKRGRRRNGSVMRVMIIRLLHNMDLSVCLMKSLHLCVSTLYIWQHCVGNKCSESVRDNYKLECLNMLHLSRYQSCNHIDIHLSKNNVTIIFHLFAFLQDSLDLHWVDGQLQSSKAPVLLRFPAL